MDRWDYKASCDAVAFLLQRLYTLGEERWKVSDETPGKVFVRLMGGERGASWYVEVYFQGCTTDSVVAHGSTVWDALRIVAEKVKTHKTLPDGYAEALESSRAKLKASRPKAR